MQRRERDNNLISIIEKSSSIEEVIKTPLKARWKKFIDANFQINFLDPPSQSYILNYFDKKIGLDMCKYFCINESYDYSCKLGKESGASCTGLNYNSCNWYNYQFLIKRLSKELNPQELELFYNLWIKGISLRYTQKRIEEHLIKHLNESNIFSNDWFISADNLKNIYCKVNKVDLGSDLIKKYESLLMQNNFDVSDKLEKLLIHYIKHFDISTPPVLKSAQEFKEMIKKKDFSMDFFSGISMKPFD